MKFFIRELLLVTANPVALTLGIPAAGGKMPFKGVRPCSASQYGN